MNPHGAGTALAHLTENELSGYLDQDLSGPERLRVEEHLEACDLCRAEAVETARLLEQDWESFSPAPIPGGGSRRWRVPIGVAGLAAAAGLAALLLFGPVSPPASQPEPQDERISAEGSALLPAYSPMEGQVVRRQDLQFAWADHGTDSYRMTLTAADGRLVWSIALADTATRPPPSVEMEPGERFFWYVDAISGGVVARTAVHEFVLAP